MNPWFGRGGHVICCGQRPAHRRASSCRASGGSHRPSRSFELGAEGSARFSERLHHLLSDRDDFLVNAVAENGGDLTGLHDCGL